MSRSPDEVSKLFAYNRWANERTLEAVSGLAAEAFGRTLGGSFPSVRGTLAHIYAAEWIWLERLRGISPPGLPAEQELPTLEILRRKWRVVEEEQKTFIDGVTPERMAQTVSYTNVRGEPWSYALGELLVHIVNHSTYHRGQVATMLRQLGKKPASTDYLVFLDCK